MAVVLTLVADKPGRAASRPMFSRAERPIHVVYFSLALDASYPNPAGYDISGALGPWDQLQKVAFIESQPQIAPGGAGGLTAGHIVTFVPDLSGKVIHVFDNNAEVGNATSLALFTNCVFAAHGYK